MEDNRARIYTVRSNTISPRLSSDRSQSITKQHLDDRKSILCDFNFQNARKFLSRQLWRYKTDDKQYHNMCFGVFILIVCIVASFPVTLIPAHNLVLHPEFWYEVLISYNLVTFFNAIYTCVQAQMVFDCFDKNVTKVVADLFISSTIVATLFLCLIHVIWTILLGYVEPIPFRCIPSLLIMQLVLFIRFWFYFPKDKSMDLEFQKRRRTFIYNLLWRCFIGHQMCALSKVFISVPLEFQWTAGFVLLLVKEINDRMYGKLLADSATEENGTEARFLAKILVSVALSYWNAIFLATTATEITGYVMIGINFVVNILLCFKIMRLTRKTFPSDLEAKQNQLEIRYAVLELIFNETIELLVPLSFIGSYIPAFYGPNQEILGSVGCNYWTFNKVDDIYAFLIPVILMAVMDCGSGLISGVLLLKFCRINILKEYCNIIKRYWLILAFSGAFSISVV